MDGVIRYLARDALAESLKQAIAKNEPGMWVRAADFDERQAQGKQREVALQDRLTAVDQRNVDLVELLNFAAHYLEESSFNSVGDVIEHTQEMRDEFRKKIETALSAPAEACQFPQSCTTRCDCDIPDFSPGNGNKARRRAELLGFKIAEDPTMAPGEIKVVQPLAKCVDPFTVCLECFGAGTICTGIEEASSTICNKCDGTGREKP